MTSDIQAKRVNFSRPNTPNRVLKAGASAPFQVWDAGSVPDFATSTKGPESSLGPFFRLFPEGNGGLPQDCGACQAAEFGRFQRGDPLSSLPASGLS
jgi:hypothetical protein